MTSYVQVVVRLSITLPHIHIKRKRDDWHLSWAEIFPSILQRFFRGPSRTSLSTHPSPVFLTREKKYSTLQLHAVLAWSSGRLTDFLGCCAWSRSRPRSDSSPFQRYPAFLEDPAQAAGFSDRPSYCSIFVRWDHRDFITVTDVKMVRDHRDCITVTAGKPGQA